MQFQRINSINNRYMMMRIPVRSYLLPTPNIESTVRLALLMQFAFVYMKIRSLGVDLNALCAVDSKYKTYNTLSIRINRTAMSEITNNGGYAQVGS